MISVNLIRIAWVWGALLANIQAFGASVDEEDLRRKADLVLANHILADQGVVDGFGHISVRSAKNPDHYFISRSRAPALVSSDDLMEYDLSDNAIDARGRSSYLERFIHSEIYKARPDVQSIVHSHSPSVIPFGVTGVPLRPIYHMAGFLVNAVPVFEIRAFAGNETDMLIRNTLLGASLAKTLDRGTAALMRGHGAVIVGSSIQTAVAHAVYMDRNALMQAQAMGLGMQVNFLSEVEATKAAETNDKQAERPWEVWKAQVLTRGQSQRSAAPRTSSQRYIVLRMTFKPFRFYVSSERGNFPWSRSADPILRLHSQHFGSSCQDVDREH